MPEHQNGHLKRETTTRFSLTSTRCDIAKGSSSARFERATYCLGGNRSIQLSYEDAKGPILREKSVLSQVVW